MAEQRMPFADMQHDKMTAWACVNAVMVWLGEPEVLFGEWRDATDGHGSAVNVTQMVNKIRHWRGAGGVKVDGYPLSA